MQLLDLIDRTEGAGNYSTLFGHSQQPGQPFAGTDVSRMTLGELADFASPSGAYGKWVAGQNNGTVATPMGRYQIVGTTLRNAASQLGLGPETVFNAGTQDRIANHLLTNRLASADAMDGKLAALRNEWHGLLSVPDDQLAQAIGGPSFNTQGGHVMPQLSTSNAPGLLGMEAPTEDEAPTGASFGDYANAAALAFNSLRRNPDAGLSAAIHRRGAMAQRRKEKIAKGKELQAKQNATVNWLQQNGMGQLAEAVEAGVLSGKDAFAYANSSPDVSASEATIQRLMELGLTREEAIKVNDLNALSRDPMTGETQIVDRLTGAPVSQAQTAPQLPAPQAPAAQDTTPELSFGDRYQDSKRAFGLGGFVRGGINAVGDAIGAGQAFPEVADTQSDFGVLRETLVNDLATGYPRQPPSWLLRQIQDLTPQAGSIRQGPGGAQDKLSALGRSVEQEMQSIKGQLNNRRLRPTLRQELEGQAASLQKVLDRVTEAHGSFGGGGLAISPDVQERMRAYE